MPVRIKVPVIFPGIKVPVIFPGIKVPVIFPEPSESFIGIKE